MADKTVTYRLLADITQFRAAMGQAAASTQAAADRMTGATKESAKFRAGLTTIGGVAGKVGLVAAAGLGAAIVTAANFDQAMSRVQGATQDSAKQMELLRTAAINAGRDTVFSATDAAAAEEEMAKAGVKTADILGGGLTGALNLASAGTISVGDAAQIAATTMNQFGLAGSQVTHIADVLAATAGKAQGDVTDMAEALKYVGPVASQMGVSLEQTAGSIGYLASQGILGSQAGTSLRGILTALTSPSKQAASAMADLGINMYDAKGNFIGLDGVAGQLHDKMSGLSNATRDQALGQIFGNQQITAARILYAGGAQAVDSWTKKVNDSGYAARLAATKMDNLKGDLEQLKGSLETALIGTGESSQGPLRKLVEGLTNVVNAYTKLPPVAQQAAGSLLGITAVLGGGTWAFAKIVIGVSNMRKALDEIGPSGEKAAAGLRAVGTATAVIGGVLILHDAIQALEKSMQEALPTTNELAGRLLSLGKAPVADIGKQFQDLGASLDYFQKNVTGAQMTSWIPDIEGLAGTLVGIKSPSENIQILTDRFSALDSALASIANNGSANKARDAFASLAASQHLTGDQQKYLLSQLPQYRDALAGAANQTKLTGNAASGASGGIKKMGGALQSATTAAASFKTALSSLSGLLDKRTSIRNYQAALDDFRKSFKKAAGFNLNVDPGRQNQAKLDAIAQAAGDVASHLHGLARTQFVDSAISQLKAMANTMNLPQKQVDILINALRTLNHTNASPGVNVGGVPQSLAEIASIKYQMAQLQSKTIYVNTVHRGGAQANADGNIHEFYANGGTHWPKIGAQQPQVRPFTGPRGLTWSEEGSGPWEAFISGHPAKADRSRAIAADVVSRLGGHVQFANGGIMAGGSSSGWSSAPRSPGAMRIEGPVEIRGRVDLDTGRLVGTMEAIAGRVVDDASDFNRTMAGRR